MSKDNIKRHLIRYKNIADTIKNKLYNKKNQLFNE